MLEELKRIAEIMNFTGPIEAKYFMGGGVDDPPAGDPPAGDPPAGDPPAGDPPAGDPPASDPPAETNWREGITDPDILKQAERFNTVEDVLKGNMEQRKKLSSAISPVTKDSSDDEVASFRKALGVPATHEEYAFPDLPEGEEMTDTIKESRSKWGKVFHENNVTKIAADVIIATYQEDIAVQTEANDAADKEFAEESNRLLHDEWKNDYDKNMKFANHAASELLGDDLEDAKHIETKDGKFVLDHPILVRMLSRIGREMGEGSLGETITETEREGLQSQADNAREKREEARSKGNNAEAKRWDEKERGFIRRLHGAAPLVGTGGKNV